MVHTLGIMKTGKEHNKLKHTTTFFTISSKNGSDLFHHSSLNGFTCSCSLDAPLFLNS